MKHPFGPDSTIEEIMDHPVVHVSWFYAMTLIAIGIDWALEMETQPLLQLAIVVLEYASEVL